MQMRILIISLLILIFSSPVYAKRDSDYLYKNNIYIYLDEIVYTINVAHGKYKIKISDGDTINVYYDNQTTFRIRLKYIDTPESYEYRNPKFYRDAKKCNIKYKELHNYGILAKKFLKNQIRAAYRIDIALYGKDIHGRFLGVIYAYTRRKHIITKRNLNFLLVEKGYAVPFGKYIENPILYKKYYNSNNSAKLSHQGIWKINESYMSCQTKIDK